VHFLKWWDHRGHELSGAIFLRAPWVGVPDDLLDLWRQEKSDLREMFLSEAFRCNPRIPAAARSMSIALGILHVSQMEKGSQGLSSMADVVASLWEVPEVEEALGQVLLFLWHWISERIELGRSRRETLEELLRALDDAKRTRPVPPPESPGVLRVLTIHGAKGLEFRRVILADFSYKAGTKPRLGGVVWDRTRGVYVRPAEPGKDEKVKGTKYDSNYTWKDLGKLAAEEKEKIASHMKKVANILKEKGEPFEVLLAAAERIQNNR
jgi:ATP-dependent exoDNAse (exonuclease V) beta subunit